MKRNHIKNRMSFITTIDIQPEIPFYFVVVPESGPTDDSF